ncbi:hypothetical protein BHE75_03251 [Sphingomonas haloaromaticamans]|uniref:Uncharacterized protein n=1 Tax=Edaphosphingomonas haloaromaticamans TaxID=653954 RepID=A0A1S1HGA0_9SPHN|nr:hypothetical protein BHE75_03251 [Sphingomonas haloaromaticamans]
MRGHEALFRGWFDSEQRLVALEESRLRTR